MALTINVGISARHLHLTQKHLEILFGEGAQLHSIKELMGGNFAAEERVTLMSVQGKKIENVRILGPLRNETQIEISKTDAMSLKMDVPLRDSGDLEGSAPITLVGPCGEVHLHQGCIVAKRHIHMSPQDAKSVNLVDNQMISIEFEGERGMMMHNVLVRVHESFTLEMHIDTDEANALDLKSNQTVIYKGHIEQV